MKTNLATQTWLGAGLVLTALGGALLAADKRPAAPAKAPVPAAESVEMFAAMKNGDIEVKLIPKNDREAKVFVKNNTKRPLTVRLPDAFAGVPVLAQAAGGKRGGGAAGGNQGMGGGMGGMGMGGGMGGGMMGGGGGGGFFNVPPERVSGFCNVQAERVIQFQVATVCLEHGKKDPRPGVPYEIRPIETLNSKPAVRELCTLLGLGGIDQRAAQAAAWHLANGMSWEQLAAKQIEHLSGPNEPYFTQEQLQGAMLLSQTAEQRADEQSKEALPTSSTAAKE